MPILSLRAGRRDWGSSFFRTQSIPIRAAIPPSAHSTPLPTSSSSVDVADAPEVGPDIKEILLKRSVRIVGAAGIAAVLATAHRSGRSTRRSPPARRWRSRRSSTRPSTSTAGSTTATRASTRWHVPGDGITHFHGDHNMTCEGPTTVRDVAFGGNRRPARLLAAVLALRPRRRPGQGSLMTGVDTLGYNIAWFSPKPMFTNVTKVCWDINVTQMSRRKWTQVLFVGRCRRDPLPGGHGRPDRGRRRHARGTGGFDLGYTSPDFRDTDGAEHRDPPAGRHARRVQDHWTAIADVVPEPGHVDDAEFDGPGNMLQRRSPTRRPGSSTACRTSPNNVVRLTQADADAAHGSFDMAGQIPQHPVRVVFQDDNYDPAEGRAYNPNVMTWHWDNIQVFTGDGAPATTAAADDGTADDGAAHHRRRRPPRAHDRGTHDRGTARPRRPPPPRRRPQRRPPPHPTTAAPTTAAPTTAAPTTAAPTTVAPTTAPTTAAPTTAAPTTGAHHRRAHHRGADHAAPTTAAPTTAAPTTAAPTTVRRPPRHPPPRAPTTAAPTTAAPTTAAPTTAAPTTAAPPRPQQPPPPHRRPPRPPVAERQFCPRRLEPAAAPNITITGGPAQTTTERDAVITFDIADFAPTQEFSGAESVTFTCSLDGGDGRVCTSPARYVALDLGEHEVVVKAADSVTGAVGSARYRWTIVAATDRSLTNRSKQVTPVDVGRIEASPQSWPGRSGGRRERPVHPHALRRAPGRAANPAERGHPQHHRRPQHRARHDRAHADCDRAPDGRRRLQAPPPIRLTFGPGVSLPSPRHRGDGRLQDRRSPR